MIPASPSAPSRRKAVSTRIPIFTSAFSQSTICEVMRTPSSICTIASTYGFIISNSFGASWTIEYVTTCPRPDSFTRSMLPMLFRPHRVQTSRGGKSTMAQLRHLLATRLYRDGISRQKRGIAISVPPGEEVDDRSRPGAAERVREPDLRACDLALSRLAPQLAHDLDRLRDARRPHGVPARLETTGGVHADPRVQRGLAVLRRVAAFPLRDEPEILDRHDLGDREVVVDLGDLDVDRGLPGGVERSLARDHSRVHRREVASVVDREEVRRVAGPNQVDGRVRELPRLVRRAQHDGGRSIAQRGAVEHPEA